MLKFCMAAVLACSPLAHAANPLTDKMFTADPAALVDNGRVYLYVGHDEAAPGGKDYVLNEWRVLSSCDMTTWVDQGSPLRYSTFAWAGRDAWAGDIAKRNGKYYFYATVDHKTNPGKAIGVAVSDSPLGPFIDARGSALVTNDMTQETTIPWDDIDPAVFIDKDGQAYLYWGVLSLQGLVLFTLYFAGIISAMAVAWVMKRGMGYNPLTKIYSLNSDTSVNYLVACTRPL